MPRPDKKNGQPRKSTTNRPEFDYLIGRFEAHIDLLRNAIESEDTRLIAISLVRLAFRALETAVMPRFHLDAEDEWKKTPDFKKYTDFMVTRTSDELRKGKEPAL